MFKATDLSNPSFIRQSPEQLWQHISSNYMVDESTYIRQLISILNPDNSTQTKIQAATADIIRSVRLNQHAQQRIDSLLLEYGLDTQEGVTLMCLAEALMRIPDPKTATAFIRDKLANGDWKSHLQQSDSVFVNASTWGLMITGKVIQFSSATTQNPTRAINRLINRFSEPVIRQAIYQAMKIIGFQFVLGRTIDEAQKNTQSCSKNLTTYSFDMLGEAALTLQDAERYLCSYLNAIEHIGRNQSNETYTQPASLSIKLSALHPRFEVSQEHRVLSELYDTLIQVVQHGIKFDVAITIDAEEADRHELSLKLFEKLYTNAITSGWGKLGLAVQAYSKRALPTLIWLNALARTQGDLIPVRLVKGAYWDSEIKWSQQHGYTSYPVFTRKEATDISYLACATFLLNKDIQGYLYPQFASHNAQTICSIVHIAQHTQFEFQRLHGMGEALYQDVAKKFNYPIRIYAPVGSHKDLLPYLVRRLLENGANSSFVHRIVDAKCPIELLTQDPSKLIQQYDCLHNNKIALPPSLFADRPNSLGINMNIESQAIPFLNQVKNFLNMQWTAGPVINGQPCCNQDPLMQHIITTPYDHRIEIGKLCHTESEQISQAVNYASQAWASWQDTAVSQRADHLNKLAQLLNTHMAEFVALCHQEAGKTINDSIDEVREAIDFCYYYAQQAKQKLVCQQYQFQSQTLTSLPQGAGVFVCISPWNFPLAIFIGQITAALVAGNTVVAKPAHQTSLIAYRAIELIHQAGFPANCVQLVTGEADVGQELLSHLAIAGVAFTGSTLTARKIAQTLAQRDCPPVPLIAETGGQNAMIADSTALPEQLVHDALRSAFSSAGQRCSALRVLYVQDEIADQIIEMIKGAMDELTVGTPYLLTTDVGPVIDAQAKYKLDAHIQTMQSTQRQIAQAPFPSSCQFGDFVAPIVFEIDDISCLKQEHFGPILHLIRYRSNELDKVIKQINATGFGLTLGIHSRNETTYQWIAKHVHVGNCYINRDQVGAVVGVQPFGGMGLSGTGPKAGGPHYLMRFTTPKITLREQISTSSYVNQLSTLSQTKEGFYDQIYHTVQ